ncbi:MAG: ABC transporter permease, partial [Vicinamibacterales bacterium]
MASAITGLTAWLAAVGDGARFGARALMQALRLPDEPAETARQLSELGVRSVPLIAAAGFAVGIVLSMHTRASLERFGAEALIPA